MECGSSGRPAHSPHPAILHTRHTLPFQWVDVAPHFTPGAPWPSRLPRWKWLPAAECTSSAMRRTHIKSTSYNAHYLNGAEDFSAQALCSGLQSCAPSPAQLCVVTIKGMVFHSAVSFSLQSFMPHVHTGKPTGVAFSHCASESDNPHCVSDPFQSFVGSS